MPDLAIQQPSDSSTRVPFFYSRAHLSGCVGGLLSLNLIHWNVLGWWWFWVLLLGYVGGYWVQRKIPHPIQAVQEIQSSQRFVTSGQNQDFDASIHLLLQDTYDQLPIEARSIALRIQDSVCAIEQKIQAQPELISEYATLSYIVFDYLPTTLDSYLKLPAVYAATKKLASGETPNQLLIQQLTLLEQQLTGLLDDILMEDLQSLVIHGQFLQQKIQPVNFFNLLESPESNESPR